MRKKRMFLGTCLVSLLLITGCSVSNPNESPAFPSSEGASSISPTESEFSETIMADAVNEILYTTPNGESGYLYMSDSVREHPEEKVPMVLMMMCTGGEARENAKACGWVDKAQEEGMIVLAPIYNNYATYSELTGIVSAVEFVTQNYPVDANRIYAMGFSNGGAVAVALASEYPQMFAAISAYGWMVDMRNRNENYDMPFQVIQGTEEYTYATDSGSMAIMDDEQRAIRSLLLFNEMIDETVQADYDAVPYWGYVPDDTNTIAPDERAWQINNYYKENYTASFAQLVLIDGAGHQPNACEADIAWEFFKSFSRNEDGGVELVEP